jgi:HNH endonuclease
VATYVPEDLRCRIDEADLWRCRYCLIAEANSGIRLTHDHITPRSKGGETSFENVCLACSSCNEHKADATHAVDPLTGETVPLFNPRSQRWSDHFVWSTDTIRVEGSTPIGRATVIALRLNHPIIVTARERWSRVGWHPPAES